MVHARYSFLICTSTVLATLQSGYFLLDGKENLQHSLSYKSGGVNDTGNVYIQVGATTIQANQSSNELYEYPVDPPLAFQEGDILDYFQPPKNIRQLILNSDITVTVHDNIDQELPPSESFDLNA